MPTIPIIAAPPKRTAFSSPAFIVAVIPTMTPIIPVIKDARARPLFVKSKIRGVESTITAQYRTHNTPATQERIQARVRKVLATTI